VTGALSELFQTLEQTIDVPLEFTRNLGGVFQDKIIAAFSPPVLEQDPVTTYRYLNSRRQLLLDGARARPLVRMQDRNLNQLAVVGQERSCHFEEIAHDSGEAGVVIRGGDYLGDFVRNAVRVEEDLHLSIDPIATQPDWPTRWGGKITQINVKRDSDGVHTVELVALANREHYKSILIGTTPWMPPEVQPIKMWMLPANIRTGCFITLFINLARLFFPPLSIITNIANPSGWLNPTGLDAILNFDPLSWPIQPQFVNPFLDQSRTSLLTAAWSNFHDATKDPLKDAGCTGRIWTYFQGDPTHPHPELESLIKAPNALLDFAGIDSDIAEMTTDEIANIARPHRNCLIAGFQDNSGIEGPTGTALDGPINLFAKTLDDLITSTIAPVDVNDDGEVDPLFRRIFGVAPSTPWAIYRDGNQSGIIESAYQQHKGPTRTIMTGGRSPKLVNDLQTFAIRWGISQIAQAITSMPGMPAELAGVEGLDNVYQGQADNILFAWMRYTNPFRALVVGDIAYQEWFEQPGSAAYTMSAVLNLRTGDFKKRAFRSFKTSIRNAMPYIILYDIMLDQRIGWEIDQIIYVDQVSRIGYSYDRGTPITYELSIGDDTEQQDPFAQGIKALAAVATIGAMAAGEGWLFN
jgi:hypothetical protein